MAPGLDPCEYASGSDHSGDEQDDLTLNKSTPECAQIDQDDSESVCVVKLLSSYEYTVPNFTIFHKKKLRHAVCQVVLGAGQLSLVDTFFREDCVPQLTPPLPVKVLKSCNAQVWLLQMFVSKVCWC